jgi:hypothetical protein
MKKLLCALLFTVSCSHVSATYELWQTFYFADTMDTQLIGTFTTKENCELVVHSLTIANMEAAMRNRELMIGSVTQHCKEVR